MMLKGTIRCDQWLLWTALLLLAVGTITVYTSSVYFAHSRMGSANALFQMYVLRLGLGALIMWFFYAVDHRFYRKHAKKAMLFSILLLALTVLRPENTLPAFRLLPPPLRYPPRRSTPHPAFIRHTQT